MSDFNSADYLTQLLKDKKQLAAFPNVFMHLERLLDEEINRVRVNLFQLGTKESIALPEPTGPTMQLTEKLYVPVKDHPEFNFVGRILGPRGMTAKQLEQETGCKIMVRGKGSMRDKAKEEQMKGKPNWEHLNDDLHVLVTVEDSKNRAEVKLKRAVEEIKKLLVPSLDGDDELKKKQLIELAIINGKYKQEAAVAASNFQQTLNQILLSQAAAAAAGPYILTNGTTATTATASPHLASALSGAPILISSTTGFDPVTSGVVTAANGGSVSTGGSQSASATPTGLSGLFAAAVAQQQQQQQQQSQQNGAATVDASGLIYASATGHQPSVHAIYHHQPTTADLSAATAAFIEYSAAANSAIDFSQAGPIKGQKILNAPTHLRAHPYSR